MLRVIYFVSQSNYTIFQDRDFSNESTQRIDIWEIMVDSDEDSNPRSTNKTLRELMPLFGEPGVFIFRDGRHSTEWYFPSGVHVPVGNKNMDINLSFISVNLEEQLDNVRELPGATGVLRIGEFFQGLMDMRYMDLSYQNLLCAF